MIEPGFIISAFVAGLITFFAPCTFPLIPVYLGLISGTNPGDLNNKDRLKELRKQSVVNAVYFIGGFTLIFILFGAFAGTFGQILGGGYRTTLSQLGGIAIIFFALVMLGVFKIPILNRTYKLSLPKRLEPGKPLTAFLIGLSIALGWTPCIGPILGAIITLAANSGTTLLGIFLMIVFSLGLAVPFLLLAFGIGSAIHTLAILKRYAHIINIIGGIFLLIIGILLLTDNFGLLIKYGYQLFGFLNYEQLLGSHL